MTFQNIILKTKDIWILAKIITNYQIINLIIIN